MSVSVIVPAENADLTTLANFREQLGLPAGTPPEAQAKRFIANASGRIRSYCRRSFGIETLLETTSARTLADPEHGLILLRWPIVEVLSVMIDGAVMPVESYTADERRLYMVDGAERVAFNGRNVSLTYRAGWHLPGDQGDPVAPAVRLPTEIESACIEMASAAFYGAGRDPSIRSESTDGVGSNTWYVPAAGASLPLPGMDQTLRPYRVVAIA